MTIELAKNNKEPLYQQIAAVLRNEIRTQYLPTDSLPSRRKLAERFKVSSLTINHAIRQLASESLVSSAGRTGTFVADPQNHSRGLIGLLISHNDPFYLAQMFGAMERKLREIQFRPVFYGGNDNYEEELRALNEIGRFKESGLIMYSRFGDKFIPQIDNLIQSGIPVMTINWPFAQADCVRIDQFMIGVLQGRYVLEKKRRELLYIDMKVKRFRGFHPKTDGFLTTIVDGGIELNHVRLEHISTDKLGREADGEVNAQLVEIIRRHFSGNAEPDSVITSGDRYLLPIVETLRSLGREPGRDVTLVSDDNMNLSGFPYVTINEQLGDIGEHAVNLLLERIDGKYSGPPRIYDVCPKLVEHLNE